MKDVLVTGATGGMGKAICTMLNEKGYRVFGLDYKEGEKVEGLHFFNCDVTNTDSITAVMEKIRETTPVLDAIVHTAGIYDMDSLIEMSQERFIRIFDINFFGVFRINKIFAPMLQKGSRIVITSSELAPLDPLPFNGIYGITKSVLEKYAFSLRMETNLLGIPVSIIRPGAVKTNLIGASNVAIKRFVDNTKLYTCNAKKFNKIVESVQARNIPASRIADLVLEALESKHPKYLYNINRNPLLLLLNSLPDRLQVDIIGMILKD
jgi:NAD(P)-dependent dehydrogenase (short-subunit alcohol dehydrogenase family)